MRLTALIVTILFICLFLTGSFADEKNITIDGKERGYIITTPNSDEFTAPYPAIFILHGGGSTAEQIRQQYPIEEAHKLGFVTIFPQAIDGFWRDGRKIFKTDDTQISDIVFFRALIDKLIEDNIIDNKNIFFTGFANGGMMAMRVACEMSDMVRAIAPIAANMPVKLKENCEPEYPLSVMIINGSDDKFTPRIGGYIMGRRSNKGRILSIIDTMEFWLKNGYCVTEPKVTEVKINDKDKNKGYLPIRKYSYKNCTSGVSIYLYEIIGGGHAIPSYKENIQPFVIENTTGKKAKNIDAALEISHFFYKHILTSN